LLNIYGSSEVAADVTYHEVAKGETTSSIAIGKPISNTQI
jgi:non-ribosomal peptide synthetase component F